MISDNYFTCFYPSGGWKVESAPSGEYHQPIPQGNQQHHFHQWTYSARELDLAR